MSYLALEIAEEDQNILVAAGLKHFGNKYKWEIQAHHVTLRHGVTMPTNEEFALINQHASIVVDGFGCIDGMVCAAKVYQMVTTGGEIIKSANAQAHITLFVNRYNNATPVMSNNIEEYDTIEPFVLSGVVKLI